MPNVGKPSRDCHLCRERRVKVSSFYFFYLHYVCVLFLGLATSWV